MQHNIDNLIDNRADPHVRSVLEDLYWEQSSRPPTRLGLVLWLTDATSNANANADAADVDPNDTDTDTDAASSDTDNDADSSDTDTDAASSDTDNDAASSYPNNNGASSYPDDDAASSYPDDDDASSYPDDGAVAALLTKLLIKEPDMRNGLKIIQVPGMYANLAVTRIGWLRRVSGDEWELIGASTIVRTGSPRSLDSLAAHGPKDDRRLTASAEAPEEIHRLVIRRSLPADVKAWAADCPRPDGWIDD
jgi:hypothetical protein